ncbi:MAG: hypothetical protein AAGI06_06830 [Pseudomonadota bacterium]
MKHAVKSAVLALAFCAGLAGPAQSEETWKVLLAQQLMAAEKCRLNYLTDVSESDTDGIKAKAHCEDKRSFDAILAPGKNRFEISACKPTYC